MKLIRSFEEYEPPDQLAAISIGTFDGVHLGHQMLLSSVSEHAKKSDGQSVVITYENHPQEVIFPERKIELICTLNHKLKLIESFGIDIVVLLTFTRAFQQQSAEEFILKIKAAIPCVHFVLGYDTRLGKNREGERKLLHHLANTHHFTLDYVGEYTVQETPLSSSMIRNAINEGSFSLTEKLLGRPYSILTKVVEHSDIVQLAVDSLCLPPAGVYTTVLKHQGNHYQAVAKVYPDKPRLEIELADCPKNLQGEEVELVFSA